jgi:hypothetical protein
MKSTEGVSREIIHEIYTIKEIESLGTYCRGGPSWPPVVLEKTPKATASELVNRIKTTGGHEGPPLQYVPCFLIILTVNRFGRA